LPEIAVWLVSDARMTALHQEFLKKQGSTDVITFQHGEIFISAEMARQNARRFGNSLQKELKLYIAHGFLHLAGFDDRNERAARKMRAAQARLLEAIS
jgi:probable rRNA maturation factor